MQIINLPHRLATGLAHLEQAFEYQERTGKWLESRFLCQLAISCRMDTIWIVVSIINNVRTSTVQTGRSDLISWAELKWSAWANLLADVDTDKQRRKFNVFSPTKVVEVQMNEGRMDNGLGQ